MSEGRGRAYDPWAHAEGLGLSVDLRWLRAGRWGEYRSDEQTVVLRRGLSHREQRCVLAHELQHVLAGDVRSLHGPANLAQERRADRAAALLLLDAAEVAEAERLREGHIGSMAHDLDVTPVVLELWRSLASTRALALA